MIFSSDMAAEDYPNYNYADYGEETVDPEGTTEGPEETTNAAPFEYGDYTSGNESDDGPFNGMKYSNFDSQTSNLNKIASVRHKLAVVVIAGEENIYFYRCRAKSRRWKVCVEWTISSPSFPSGRVQGALLWSQCHPAPAAPYGCPLSDLSYYAYEISGRHRRARHDLKSLNQRECAGPRCDSCHYTRKVEWDGNMG